MGQVVKKMCGIEEEAKIEYKTLEFETKLPEDYVCPCRCHTMERVKNNLGQYIE